MDITTSAQNMANNVLEASKLVYVLLVPTFIMWYIYWRLSRKHLYELAEKIPGPKGLPLVGNIKEFQGSAKDIFHRVARMINDSRSVTKFWIGPKLLVFLYEPSDVEVILNSSIHIDKSDDYRFFKPWLGDGLLVSTGTKWRAHRKLIAPTFHLNVIKNFFDVFNKNSRQIIQMLNKKTGVFDCHDQLSACTVKILLETVMGVGNNTINVDGYEYADTVMKMCDLLHLRHVKFWLNSDFLFHLLGYAKLQKCYLHTIHEFTSKVLKLRKNYYNAEKRQNKVLHLDNTPGVTSNYDLASGQQAALKDELDIDFGEKKRYAFLDLLLESPQLENGTSLTEEEIKDQVNTIMFEGHDTTAAATSFFLSLMGIHQNIQDEVIEELNLIFGDSDRPVTFEDTLEMKYLERCLMETLRLFPPVPIIGRRLNEDVTLPTNGLKIPAGATVVINPYTLHHNEKYFPNPDKFNPDNFLPQQTSNRHYYAFIPFSAGPRNCVGRKYAILKMKTILANILRNFRIYSDVTESDFKLQADIILKREEGFNIRLESRKKAVN